MPDAWGHPTALEAYLGRRDQNQQLGNQAAAAQLQQATGLMALMSQMKAQQEAEQVKGVMANSPDLPTAITGLQKLGTQPAIKTAMSLSELIKEQTANAEAKRQQQFFSPENQQRFMVPGAPGSPGVAKPEGDVAGPWMNPTPDKPPQMDVRNFAMTGAMQGIKGMEPLLNHMTQRDQAQAQLAQTYQLAHERLQRDYALAEQRGADQRELAQMRIDAQRQMAALAASLRQPPNTQVIDTQQGKLQRNPQTGAWEPVIDPTTGQRARGMSMTGGTFEANQGQRFESNPIVKAYVSLAPDVEVMNNYMAKRDSVPVSERAVYDKDLVNNFMRVTHPKGDQISNFERKDLAGLPALPDRITRAIVGFMNGQYVPDNVATEMAKIVNEKFKAKGGQVNNLRAKMVEDMTRNGASPDAIRDVVGGNAPKIAPGSVLKFDAQGNPLP